MSEKYALIIGNSQYQDPVLRQLVTPGKDAEGFSRVLEDLEIGAFDEVKPLVNQPEAALRRVIERFFKGKKKDDLLVLYFSGHGLLDDQGQLYFAVQYTERDALFSSAIPASFIR